MPAHESGGGGPLYPSESDSLLSHTPSAYSMAMATSGDDATTRTALLPAADGSAVPATETTRLLGGERDETEWRASGAGAGGLRKDSWVGAEDFAGLPWWKTPSVRGIEYHARESLTESGTHGAGC